jgi:hypothetical protein
LRHQFFTGARLAHDEYRCGGIRDRIDQLADLSHRRAVANDGIRLAHAQSFADKFRAGTAVAKR